MPEITCSARKCVYNDEGYCERENIKIDVDDCDDVNSCTCCDSFAHEDECDCSCNDCSCKNCAGNDANVECLAVECIYNENRECVADYISVEGRGATDPGDTFCDTYRTRT